MFLSLFVSSTPMSTEMRPSDMDDHVTFSVSPFSSSTPVLLLAATLSPPPSVLTCPELKVGKGKT